MSEKDVIYQTLIPATVDSLQMDFAAIGMSSGQSVLVHSSLSSIGYVAGGAQSVIEALLSILGDTGTLMMATHTGQNTDPANWKAPPVPATWWPILRDNQPAFDPAITPTRGMGAIPELFRTYPKVIRSNHPTTSFAAVGKNADYLLSDHNSLESELGESSPIGKLYELDGYVLLIGVLHDANTSLHLAEYRATCFKKNFTKEGTARLVDGTRQWVNYEMLALDRDDFISIGDDFSKLPTNKNFSIKGKVGLAEAIFVQQRPLVDFAVNWMNRNR